MSGLVLNLVLVLVGAVVSVLAALKWRSIRFSAAAILVFPQVIYAITQKHWLVVEVVVPLMIIAVLVDVSRSRRTEKNNET